MYSWLLVHLVKLNTVWSIITVGPVKFTVKVDLKLLSISRVDRHVYCTHI
jgi:hypothetical protein